MGGIPQEQEKSWLYFMFVKYKDVWNTLLLLLVVHQFLSNLHVVCLLDFYFNGNGNSYVVVMGAHLHFASALAFLDGSLWNARKCEMPLVFRGAIPGTLVDYKDVWKPACILRWAFVHV